MSRSFVAECQRTYVHKNATCKDRILTNEFSEIPYGTVTRSLPPNPFCPGTIRAEVYDEVLGDTLVPMARRLGLAAVAKAYDDGMSVSVLAGVDTAAIQ